MKILKKKIYILYMKISKNGILHFSFVVLFMIGSLLYLPIRILFVFYVECELLSWIVFKNECLFSYLYKKNKDPNYSLGDNPELEDIYIPHWLHYLGYAIRVYFYSTLSTWYYSLLLIPLYILERQREGVYEYWLTNWRYLLVPIVLYLFHGYKTPFDFFSKKKHKEIIYLSITLFAIYLGYILFKYPNSSDLYEPIFVSYCLLTFIGIGTSI